jgi:hypothetical protein
VDDFDAVAIVEGDVFEVDLAFEFLVGVFLRIEDIAILRDDFFLVDDVDFGIEELADLFGSGLGGHEVAEDL